MDEFPYNTEDFKELAQTLVCFEHYMIHYPGLSEEAAADYLKNNFLPKFTKFFIKYGELM